MPDEKSIGEMTAEIRANNIEKGWRAATGGPGANTFGDYLALLHSEVSEALEAYRDHRLADATEPHYPYGLAGQTRPPKPEGVGSELADVLIRTLDMADVFGVRVSGYDHLSNLRAYDPGHPVDVVTFGDHMAWLHREASDTWGYPIRLALVLRTLVTVARKYDIDLTAEYERKIAYNRTRPHQHGGRTVADGVGSHA